MTVTQAMIPSVTLPSSYSHLIRVLGLVVGLSAWSYAFDALMSQYGVYPLGFTSPLKLAFYFADFALTLGGFVVLGCVILGKTSLKELGWTLKNPVRGVGLGLLQTGVVVGLVFLVYFGMAGMGGVSGLASNIAAIPLSERLFLIVAGTKVAIVEETLFRGDLLGRLVDRWGPALGVVVSSVIFALYHRTFATVPLSMKLVFGLIFAVTTLKSRSLVPSTIGHTLLWVIVGNN